MSEFTKALLVANIFRYLLIAAGTAFAYMGYRLFVLGYFEKSGELKANFGDNHLLLRQVAPGVFFAALGVLTIATGVFRRIEITVPTGIDPGGKAFMSDNRRPCNDVGANGEYFSGKGDRPAKQTMEDKMPPKK